MFSLRKPEFFLLLPLIGFSTVQGATLKDPFLRDDDVSLTSLSVSVSRNSQGLYVYTYDIKAPLENTGSVGTFVLDISCPEPVDSRGFDPRDFPSDASPSFSRDGKHIPVAIDAPLGQSFAFGISEGNAVHWGMVADPGSTKTGLQLITPYPPGAREYRLVPSMRYREEEWDYGSLEEDDETVPWTDDFTVTGITTGPACPGEEYPDDGGGGEVRFPGSPFAGQPELLNELLTYSAPLVDQFHVAAGTRELELTIHYHASIDPHTFRVTPEKHHLRRLFNPKPGTRETVRLPLEPGKNRIELQVQSRFVPPGQGDRPAREVRGRGGVSLDRDVFVIRVPAAEADPGTGRKGAQGGK